MRRVLLFLVALIAVGSLSARELVVKLADGTRWAFHIDNRTDVCMTKGEGILTFNGMSFNRAEVVEMRIFQNLPEGVLDGIEAVRQTEDAALEDANAVDCFDMSGRRIARGKWQDIKSRLPKGTYIVNSQKFIKK